MILYLRQSDEFGVARESLAQIAHGSKTPIKYLRELAQKGVLKGGDEWHGSFEFSAKHAGKVGEPVTLVEGDGGSCWFYARLVKDKHVREQRGKASRFTSENQPGRSPTGRVGSRQGDGPASASASASASSVDTSTHTDSSLGSAPDLARVCREAGYSECSDSVPDLVRAKAAGVSEAVMLEAARAGAAHSPTKPIAWVAARAIAKAADAVAVPNIEDARKRRAADELAERERAVENKRYTIANDFNHGIIDEPTRDERLAAVDRELREIAAERASS
ncbi:hypothetical protein [Pseudoxanthomonas sp. USHLN014]|uniref:hypothetical protein n=1 Tax=Pseudoxanthomonas sp. USHLN014 TaxID=3081297 RepID=UPI00301BB21A